MTVGWNQCKSVQIKSELFQFGCNKSIVIRRMAHSHNSKNMVLRSSNEYLDKILKGSVGKILCSCTVSQHCSKLSLVLANFPVPCKDLM